jgi:demethylmenaquinone methyltransferase / 2-methoxy-6-polyprenyl-1,4-benzoquinol methylase
MAAAGPRPAADGSPYPDRSQPTFERDLRRMFAHIARGYERFNHLSTFGNDVLWRFRALGQLDRFRAGPVERALDLGCGTGEFARAIARRYPRARVVACDFTHAMLEIGREGGPPHPEFAAADAQRLPFASGSFDLITNAFVARNLKDLAGAFAEWKRVLRPGGVALTLDITEPARPALGRLFHAYFDSVVPMLGRSFKSEGPYRYLPESLPRFPARAEVLELLRSAGFARAEARDQSGGIVTTFLAEAWPAAARRG